LLRVANYECRVVHFHSGSLSLPISPVVSALAVILPIISFVNAFIYPTLLRYAQSSNFLAKISPYIFQGLQTILTTILATLLADTAIPTETMDCLLETKWKEMFINHDSASIKRIQDMLNCCGFNSVKDRAYPFPDLKPSTCSATYGRTTACKEPWREALQNISKIDFAVVLAVGVIQIIGLLLMKEGTNWWTAWRTRRAETTQEAEARGLLRGADEDEEIRQRQSSRSGSYGSMVRR
jgi:hypothetical protein